MYRCVIEHPDFVPEELKNRPDQRFGDDRGRIWRIVPAGEQGAGGRSQESGGRSQGTGGRGQGTGDRRQGPGASLGRAASAELVALLEHPNAWQRETAHRLLLERQERPVAAKLRELARSSRSPQARCHALQLLAGLGVIEEPDLQAALADADPHVRRQGLLVAERADRSAVVAKRMEALVRDAEAGVRFQARLTWMLTVNGNAPQPRPVMPDYEIFLQDVADPWMNVSTFFYLRPEMASVIVQAMVPSTGAPERAYTSAELVFLEQLVELATGAESSPNFVSLGADSLRRFSRQPEVGLALLKGMAKAWGRRRVPDEQRAQMPVDRLTAIASDPEASPANRTAAISLLAFAPAADGQQALAILAKPGNELPIRLAAIAALARHQGNTHWPPLLEGFASDTPPVRRAILDGLLANPDRTKLLLDALEAGRIKASEIDLAQAKRLTAHREAAIRERAAKLFEAATPAERAKALADYQPVLKLAGDPRRGQALFEKNCAACHRIAGIGVNVAPDISDSRTKKLDQLLTDIIQPNRAIDNNYLAYTVRLVDGTVATGILATETATSITLRQQGGKDAVIARSEIDELRSMGVSLMPEGLERQIPPQEMADLLAFIKNWRYLDGRTPVSSVK
jgi:putative heme-binding domain-containing protein